MANSSDARWELKCDLSDGPGALVGNRRMGKVCRSFEQRMQLIRIKRPRDEVTLGVIAAIVPKEIEASLIFNAFTNHSEAKRMRQLNRRANHQAIAAVLMGVLNKGAVNLELFQWQFLDQVTRASVASASSELANARLARIPQAQ